MSGVKAGKKGTEHGASGGRNAGRHAKQRHVCPAPAKRDGKAARLKANRALKVFVPTKGNVAQVSFSKPCASSRFETLHDYETK